MRLNSTNHIIQTADHLVRMCETRDPERIARELGIVIYNVNFKRQKGAYKVIKRNRCIFVNENLNDVMRSIVILHELGHDQLHRKHADSFQEFQLFDMQKDSMEYEANLFASQIALPDDEITEYVYQGFSIDQIAGEMNSDINLVAIKIAELSRRGYAFRMPDYKSNFLK